MPLSRRTFLAWLGTTAAAAKVGARGTAFVETPLAVPDDIAAPSPLDPVTVSHIADVVLPSELGPAGPARVSRAFVSWVAGYRKGAEVVHGYGNPNLRFLGDSPAARWRQQLDALDQAARGKYGKSFAALRKTDRETLIRAAIANERLDRMPDPLAANHVVVALVAYYFGSSEANDLCYRATIGRNQCRPLADSPRQPLPLASRRGA